MMVAAAAPSPVLTRLSVAEFESLLALPENQERLLELIDGEIEEKMPTETHAFIAANITIEIGIYLKSNKIARVLSEARHGLPDDPYNDRIPDISVNLDVSRPLVTQGAIPKMPDFAIEIKSPDDSYAKMRAKAEYYLEHGTRLVWLVYPERAIVEVYQTGGDSELYTVADTLDGGAVLPDFQLPVQAIFAL